MAWPNIREASTIRETSHREVFKSNVGYIMTRPKWTRTTRKFNLKWKNMTTADKATLQTFFDDNVGSSFDWTYSLTSTTYTVIFGSDSLVFSSVAPGFWSISLKLEEV